MTDPRDTDLHHTNPPPNPRTPSSGPMWAWIAGIAVVVLIAFAFAVGWNDNPQTAGNEPPATVGSGGATMPPATAERGATGSGTTGSGASAPATTPSQPDNPAPGAGGQ